MNVRRVVTGVSQDGKSAVISDDVVAPLEAAALFGYAWHRLWSVDSLPETPNVGNPEPAPNHFPPPGGLRFNVFTVPPSTLKPPADLDRGTADQEIERKFPGRSQHMERDQTGLHRTASVDFVYVAEGEIWLELDDGKEVHLKTGDVVVQNGVRHAWRNHSKRPCTMVICLVGTAKKEV
jgi:quercetin dioxygenase-like cupin family protein